LHNLAQKWNRCNMAVALGNSHNGYRQSAAHGKPCRIPRKRPHQDILDLPQDGRLLTITKSIEAAMKSGTTADVRRACAEFLKAASEFYKVPACGIDWPRTNRPAPLKLG
jgi:hypothetical protein